MKIDARLFNDIYEVYSSLEDLSDEDLIECRDSIRDRVEMIMRYVDVDEEEMEAYL